MTFVYKKIKIEIILKNYTESKFRFHNFLDTIKETALCNEIVFWRIVYFLILGDLLVHFQKLTGLF